MNLDRTYANAQWSTLLEASRIAKNHCANPKTGHEPGTPGCGACQTSNELHALAGKVHKVVDIDAKEWIAAAIFDHDSWSHEQPRPNESTCHILAEIILAGPCWPSAASEGAPAGEPSQIVDALEARLSDAQARADALADRVCMLEGETSRAHIRIDGVCTDVVDAGREIDSLRRKVG